MSNASRILIALVAGLGLGILLARLPGIGDPTASVADVIGTLWLSGLRMTIVPLVVALLVTGIVQSAQAARAGRIAARTVAWIIGLMTFSAIVGAILTPLFLHLFPLPADSAAALRGALGTARKVADVPPVGDFIRAIVPTNPLAAAANDAILPLIIFTAALAFAITRLPDEGRGSMTRFFAALADAMIIVVNWVLRLAPIGVFALALVVGVRSGSAGLGALLHYVVTVAAVGLVVGLFAFPVAMVSGRQKLGQFARAIAPVQALAISTQSSLACLPLMLRKSEDLGVREPTAGLVLPMAVALLRVTGPAMNLAVALYVANWFGVPLGPAQYGVGILAAVLTSLGAVSLPGQVSFFTSIVPISLAIGTPVEPLALLIAVETLPDIFRTLGNVQMDVALTTVIEQQTKDDVHAVSHPRTT